ncbi:MAG: hypothetical protein DHS20C11_10830 [Lysobacteraceae bacterium]|nr:MAG: hypothetical protein DHS20C11_10830 [Xanthomonadaceae bacterium]
MLLTSTASMASSATEQEIAHLLHYVANTSCLYDRNGKHHEGAKARSHIERKYRYFADQIESTEDFIRLAASKSTVSGKPYRVICDDNTFDSEDWFTAELIRFRQQQTIEENL